MEKVTGFLIIMSVLFIVGCETVTIKERVIYEDGLSVVGASVHQWTDEGYNGYATTDKDGWWSLEVPPDTRIHLCIKDPKNENELACYECGILITPALNSDVTAMINDGCDDLEYVGDE